MRFAAREEDDDASEEDHEADIEARESVAQFRIATMLEHLPRVESEAIQLYYLEHKTQTAIAEICGVTQAAVSYRIKRGLAKLRLLAA